MDCIGFPGIPAAGRTVVEWVGHIFDGLPALAAPSALDFQVPSPLAPCPSDLLASHDEETDDFLTAVVCSSFGDAPTAAERLCRPKLVLDSRGPQELAPDRPLFNSTPSDLLPETEQELDDWWLVLSVPAFEFEALGEEKIAIRDSGKSRECVGGRSREDGVREVTVAEEVLI